MSNDNKKIVLTCAQPTGKLHLGNYLGAVKNWVALLKDHECFFGIVDMHAITMPYVPADLRRSTLECAAQYIACGLDPKDCHIFIQSQVTGHAELAWILSCLTPVGQLQRMTQFKDKSNKQNESISSGLLYYPVLMAADILLYNTDIVPVGHDQKQHIELTRDLAEKFNSHYSETFKVPEAYIPKVGARIMSLQNPENKMSKSDPNQNGTLYLLDDPKILRKKIMSAVTDSGSEIVASEEKPGITNLLNILSVASNTTVKDLEKQFQGLGYADLKKAVADAVTKMFTPIRKKYNQLIADKNYLNEILKNGADAAQKKAYRTLSKVYRKSGYLERGK